MEYSFGPNLFRKSGIAECNPKEGVENADFKEQLHMGDTSYTKNDILDILDRMDY